MEAALNPVSNPGPDRADAYHHGDLRRALVGAACDLLERDGQDALSLRRVAAAAGVSRAAPYHHFAGKDALLAAVAAEGFRALGESMRRHAADVEDPSERLCGIGVGYVVYAVDHPALFRLMQGPYFSGADRYEELHAVAGGCFEILRDTVAACLPDARPEAIETACAAAWSLVHGLATLCMDGRMENQVDARDPEALARRVTRLLDVSLARAASN